MRGGTLSRLAAMLVLGGLLHAAHGLWLRTSGAGEAIVISSAELERRVADWTTRRGAPPSAEERARLEAELVDEELLFRHGLGLGLDTSTIARQRLLDLADFLEVAGLDTQDPEVRIAAARELGVHLRDPVIRRHVVQAVRLAATRAAPERLPSEAELRAYLEREAARFERPARVEVSHVFLSRSRRGEAARQDAHALQEKLQSEGRVPSAVAREGDLFFLGSRLPLRSQSELARAFGGEVAERAMDLAPGRWSPPLRSSYGWHLVWVHERVPARVPPLATIRGQVVHRYLRDQGSQRLRELLVGLRGKQPIRFESGEDA